MCGLSDVEKEAVHPDDTSVKRKRKIKSEEVESTRRSDRQLGEDITIEKIEFGVKSRSLKSLKKLETGDESDLVMKKNGIISRVSDCILVYK